MKSATKLIAIVGGSGAGKTWLAHELTQRLQPDAACLSLDDFYKDRSSLSPRRRELVNYDHPRAIDWLAVELVLSGCRTGRPVCVPHYDLVTHTRRFDPQIFAPRPVVLVEGLWLLWRPEIRSMFDFSVYLDCPTDLRFERRMTRDLGERGRQPDSVREQFKRDVIPMHNRFVAPQTGHADLILSKALESVDVEDLAETIRMLVTEECPSAMHLPASNPALTTDHLLEAIPSAMRRHSGKVSHTHHN